MKIYEITFSPSGGTKKVADILVNELNTDNCDVRCIDLVNPSFDASTVDIQTEDLCVLAVPAYAGRVPDIAVSRIQMLQGHGAKAILAAVYGNREIDDTLLELHDVSVQCDFIPVAGISAIAEHSLARTIAAHRPDAADQMVLEDFAKQILEKLKNESRFSPAVPGKRPYKPSNASNAKPVTSKICTACGLCASQCPVGAIPNDTPDRTDSDRCISCMRCVSLCPKQARKVPDNITDKITGMLSKLCPDRKENQLFI